MHIAIRVDSSRSIGSGHLMRTLALAHALREAGAQPLFISRKLPGALLDLIREKSFPVAVLDAPHESRMQADSPWFGGIAAEQDARETAAMLRSQANDFSWLIVDHYGIDEQWENQLRPHVARIAVIDDLANRRHDCDLLVDANVQTNAAERYEKLVPRHCRRLQGPSYALLREEFVTARKTMAERSGYIQRVLVSYGGTDQSNLTLKTIEAIRSLGRAELTTDVVVGSTNPHSDEVARFCGRNPGFTFHCQTDRMADLMMTADVAIGAGGITIWERAALALPSIVISVAANQEQASALMAAEGRMLYLGSQEAVSAESIAHTLAALCDSPVWARLLSRRSGETVDGRGTSRLVRALLAPAICLRPATGDDCGHLFDWRNDKDTRAVSHRPEPLNWQAHQEWFRATLSDPARILLIATLKGTPVGMLRYDISGETAIVSINLAPEYRGQGLGPDMLTCGNRWLRDHHVGVRRIHAEIVASNWASRAAFAEAGFRLGFTTLFQKI